MINSLFAMKRIALLGLALSALAVTAFAAPGDLLPFNPNPSERVHAAAVQPDGRIVIAGFFEHLQTDTAQQITRQRLARLNADGTSDASFYPFPNAQVYAVAALENGKILVGGDFTSFKNGGASSENPVVNRTHLARLNSDGSVDESFNANLAGGWSVLSILPLADGRIYIGGNFMTVGGVAHARVALLNENGSPDNSFSFQAGAEVTNMAVDEQNRVLLGSYGNLGSGLAVRVSAAGVLDSGFTPAPDFTVFCLQPQADGQVLIGGNYDNVGGQPIKNLARVNATSGLADTDFQPGAGAKVFSTSVLTNGKILVTGDFSQFQPPGAASPTARSCFAMLEPSGNLDTSFNPIISSVTIFHSLVQSDGSLLLLHTGDNVTAQGVRHGITRLEGDSASSVLSPTSTSRVQWLRGGALAEPAYVVFDQSTDNGTTWTRLGTAIRTTGGWELTGLSLPNTGKLRAHARVNSSTAYYGCSSVLESVVDIQIPIVVPGSANVWLAGLPSGTARNTDSAPGASPVEVNVTLTAGQDVTFTVTGGTHNGPVGPGTTGPDGGSDVTHETENSIAELKAPLNSLVGVFLNGNEPSGSTQPYRDFNVPAHREFDLIKPGLQQPFFIGDGRRSDDFVQHVRIPAGATRLFVGSLDEYDNETNSGAFEVDAEVVAPLPEVPVPTEPLITSGEPGQNWEFSITQPDLPGLTLRLQSTLTSDPGGWADLPGGGLMELGIDNVWTLALADLPLGHRSFRIVQMADGHAATTFTFPQTFRVSSPAGRILYTRGSFGSSELVLMEADGSDKVVLTDNTFSPLRCAMSPNGLMVAFTTFSGELFLMKAEPMNGTTNIPVNILEDSSSGVLFNAIPVWSADGIHIAYADSSSHIQVIAGLDENGAPLPFDASTNPLYDVFTSFASEPNLAWSPNGKYLALTEGSLIQAFQVMDDAGDIIPGGSSTVTLTLPSDFATQKKSVAWSADGSQIAFVEENSSTGATRVSLLTVDTGTDDLIPEHATTNPRVKLTTDLVTSHAPQHVSWSPDGTLLALETDDAGTHRIEVIKPEEINETLNPLVPLTFPASGGNSFQPVFQQPKTALIIPQLVAFQSAIYAGNEDDEEPITVRVVRTGLTAGEIEVPFTVTDGTAIEGLDFTLSESPLIFADGESEKTIIVTPLLDAEDQEIDETLELTLVAPPDVDLGGIPSTTVTINDSDSSAQPFAPPSNELTVAVNDKLLKTGTAKSGDILSFKARQEQGWALGGIQVKVQYTTNTKDPASWLNLPEPLLARSTNTSLTWVADTRKFPVGKLYFRTRTYALKHRSNAGPVVGPFTISAAPVLELTMTVDTDSDPTGLTVKPSEFINYRIKCKNIGTATATKVLLNSRLPQSTRFDSASNAHAPYFKEVKDKKGVTTDTQWNVGNINAGAEVNEFLTVQVNSVEQIEYNRLIQNDRLTYKIGSGKEVFMPTFRTTVSPPIKITAAKDKSIVVAGDLITYTLTIRNEASYPVTGGKVTDQVPTGARLITAAYGDGAGNYLGIGITADTLEPTPIGLTEPGFTPHNGMLTWNVGDIEAGGSRQLRFTVRVAYDLFEKLTRNGESFNVQIQNLNFDFTGTPPSGGVIAARGGFIPFSDIARTFVSAVPPTSRPEIGLQKLAVSDTVTKLGSSDIAGIFVDGRRQIEYEIGAWNYGTAPADETEIYDGIPFETEINADNPIIGSATTDTFTSEVPHQLTVGQKVRLPYLTGGAGLTMTTIYFVKTVPSATEFTVAKTATGVVLNFTTDVTAGTLRRFVYDTDAFMRKFSINGNVQHSSADFLFFDANGSQLAPGGEPFIDRDNDGIIDTVGKKDLADFTSGKSEFIDQNGNSKYDGPEAIRTFAYDLGTLPPMTAPNMHRLTYRVQLAPKVARGEYIAALSSAVHKKGAGLELTCPDFYYPVIGTPPIEFAKVVAKLEFAMERPRPRDNGFIGGTPGVYQVAYDLTFTNKGDFFANDTQLRIPIPAGFTTPSGRQPIDKRNAAYDAAITGSPGTAVFDIGEVAPGATVTRQLVLNMTVPIPPALLVKGQLKNYSALIAPRVVATKLTTTSIFAPPPAGKKATDAIPPPPVVAKMNADGSFTITTPIQQTPTATRVFIGRVSYASVQEGTECDFFIFFGNSGYESSGAGEVAMQVPYGTRLVSADPLSYNTLDNASETLNFSPGYFKIEQIKGKRRLEDGTIDVVRWKFANIPPSAIYCVKMVVHVNRIFPGSSIIDKSAYISVSNAAAKSASPITVKVRKDSSGAVDWWQGVGDLLQGVGNFVDDSMRHLFGGFTKEITFNSNVVSLGGPDFVQMDNGTLVIPLGSGRSAIIGPYSLLAGKMPGKSFLIYGDGNGIALAAGATTGQQVLVGGTTNAYRNVHQILNELHTVNSIVAGGGGNIVAAGGGNIVAGGGGNIVAAGGGNVVANDGAGLAPLGFISFTNPPSIVAGGGGNIVAAGGGNIVAAGGGNIVAAGGGNIVAAGGGNIVAAGGGNIVEIGSKQIPPVEMTKIINTLVGQDGASLTDIVLQKDIGSVVANDGAGVVLDPEALASQGALSLIGNDAGSFQGGIGEP